MSCLGRPYVVVGGFMSVDGKTAPKNLQGRVFMPLMGRRLQERLHRLRSEVDCILVGVKTVLTDNPRLTVRLVDGKSPLRVVLDSKARTPLNSAVLNVKEAPTLIAVSRSAPPCAVEGLRGAGAEVVECGDTKVDIRNLLEKLYERGVRRLLVEGGSEVRWSFLSEGVVDELFVWVMPMIWGGKDAPTIVDGEGFTSPREAIMLELKQLEVVENIITMNFLVKKT
ncbi:MAG: 2,5-diamino-6-(ribosylamino)-4(3H)-pyrimidinone 5'-phosphate reductase [Candidatus Bathyarchaeia archaeon]